MYAIRSYYARSHDLGRVGIGLGLILLALHLLLGVLAPAETAPAFREALDLFTRDPTVAALLAAVIAWAASMTDLRAEPHTLLTVKHSASQGIPAKTAACLAGFWP